VVSQVSDLKTLISKLGPVPMEQVKDIIHSSVDYNPAKAHEYYLRTRELSGRTSSSNSTSNTPTLATKTVSNIVKPTISKPSAETKQQVETRVADMKVRLTKLRKLLTELVKQAKARSGIDPTKDPNADPATKKLTAAERKEAAKKQAEYRKKHPEEDVNISEEAKRLEEQIKDVNAKIAKARADLTSAVAKGRTGLANTTSAA
jgi:hypothetical protein